MRRMPLALAALLVVASSVIASSSLWAAEAESKASPIGRSIENFSLRDYRGKETALADFKDSKCVVVAFLGTECPLAKLYGKRLAELAEKYESRGVTFLGVNSNQQDSITEIASYARVHEIEFPVLKDPSNKIADRFGAVRTPEVFVLDAERKIRYWGRIDDRYGVGFQRSKANREDLVMALDELLAGNAVSQPVTAASGCHIARLRQPQPNSAVTYSNQIARIIQNRCVECHRPGEIAPFPLTSYEEVVGWAETIEEVVQLRRMPPWHASPEYGHFSNSAQMPDDERKLIERWVAAGAPEGDPKELPKPREFIQGWRIPKPDLIVATRTEPFKVPAQGEVKYQYFIVDPGFKEDKWIKAAECRPGNRAVVHHLILHLKPGNSSGLPQGHSEVESEWVTATAPGAMPLLLPDGMAKRIPAGSQFVFQVHYTPNGSPQEDLSSVGLVFADPATVKKEVGTWRAVTHKFAIPPGAANHPVEANFMITRDSLILAMFPHMHVRGKAFRYEAVYPDGKTEVLLDIPNYDFNWQNAYHLAEPKKLPAGTRVHCLAHFDNSEANLANPNPKATVRWGDQTWEEMMIGHFDAVLADQDLTKTLEATTPSTKSPRTDQFQEQLRKRSATGAAGQKEAEEQAAALKKLAAAALDSDEAFAAFGQAVQAAVPQVDRVCLTVIENGKLRVERDAQSGELKRLLGGRGLTVNAARLAVAGYATADGPTLHQDLSKATAPDLQAMHRAFSASLHLPVKFGGLPATLNFWSREANAFPTPASDLLKELGPQVVKDR